MLRRTRRRRPQVALEPQPDDLPKRGLFSEPVRITRLESLDPEPQPDGQVRVTFLLEVKDAEDRRCSDLAVDVTVTGPERSSTVQPHTDLLGRARVRMSGPAGNYHLEVLDVAARGLDWAADAGPRTASVEVELPGPA